LPPINGNNFILKALPPPLEAVPTYIHIFITFFGGEIKLLFFLIGLVGGNPTTTKKKRIFI